MQDEINEKTVAFVIKGGKLSAQTLALAMREYLKHRQNKSNNLKVGRHKLSELLKHGGSYSSVEISKSNIKSFEKVAEKHNVVYGIEKDKTQDPPIYYVFFQSNNKDAFDYAFREYTAKVLNHKQRPSIRQKLHKFREEIKKQHTVDKVRNKDRDLEL